VIEPLYFADYGTFKSKKETDLPMVYTTTQAHNLPRRSELSKRHILSRYTCNCDVICGHKI